jgi:hypothetical protein
MRHLFNRGFINQWVFQETHCEALLALRPEIYGNIAEEKVENGLLYVIERLPGIEECRFINLTLMKGIQNLIFKQLFPWEKRNCYRIDEEQMNVEIRGRSDIYDILTHLTFILLESHKIRNRVLTMLVKYLVIG